MNIIEHEKRLIQSYRQLIQRIRRAEFDYGRPDGSVTLVAVGKTYPASDIRLIAKQDQVDFGENYLQDALPKIGELSDLKLRWHFIGHIQSNKCRDIAGNFDWIHSIDRYKIARRLSEHRTAEQPTISLFIQVNLQNEVSKAGVSPDHATELAHQMAELPNVRLRGLMAIPEINTDFASQRKVFAELRELQEQLIAQGLQLDCLSMGMTNDLEAAIAEGATHVRIGTAIFGPRQKNTD